MFRRKQHRSYLASYSSLSLHIRHVDSLLLAVNLPPFPSAFAVANFIPYLGHQDAPIVLGGIRRRSARSHALLGFLHL
jgi:hypothetical protein